MRAAEHVAFADDAGRNGDEGDGGVEFCVGGGEENFVEGAAVVVSRSLVVAIGVVVMERGVRGRGGGVDHEGELVNKFEFPDLLQWAGRARQTAEEIDHTASGERTDPDVAVDNPYYISLCFSVAPAHVPDLRVRPKVVYSSLVA